MRRAILVLALALCVCLAGCSAFSGALFDAKEKTAALVVKADDLAAENEAIVERLVLERASVTEDEEVTAIRNARALHVITGTVRKVWTDE